jgi:pimeloyl-ACP methyl ester carboxylesterase
MKKPLRNLLLTGAAIAIPALINNAIFAGASALGSTLGGEGRFWMFDEGDVFYTKQGQGKPPIVLVHGIYAGASSYEWRKNFDSLGEHFTVYAFDWLGFGLSDKPKIRYRPDMYVRQLIDFLKEVVAAPAAVVASSLGATYAIEAAKAVPELIEHLFLVSPAGMKTLSENAGSLQQEAIYQAASSPIIGTSLYNAITCRASLRTYLQDMIYFDPSYVSDEMVDHYSTASHQYGCQYAVQSFIGGQLNHSVRESLPEITSKTLWVIWGREAKQSPLSDAEAFLAANPSAELKVIDKAGLLPHDEQASTFNRLITEALTEAPAEQAAKKQRKRTPKPPEAIE